MLNCVVIACDGSIDQVFFLMRQISYEIGFHTIHYKKNNTWLRRIHDIICKKNIVWFFAIYFSYSLYSRCVCMYEWIVCFFFFFIRRLYLFYVFVWIWLTYLGFVFEWLNRFVRFTGSSHTVLKWDSKCKPIHTYLNQNMMCFKDTNDIFCWVRVSVFDDYTALFYDT